MKLPGKNSSLYRIDIYKSLTSSENEILFSVSRTLQFFLALLEWFSLSWHKCCYYHFLWVVVIRGSFQPNIYDIFLVVFSSKQRVEYRHKELAPLIIRMIVYNLDLNWLLSQKITHSCNDSKSKSSSSSFIRTKSLPLPPSYPHHHIENCMYDVGISFSCKN